jgi:hypothetical protein
MAASYAALVALAALLTGCAEEDPAAASVAPTSSQAASSTAEPEVAETAQPMALAEVFEGSDPVSFDAPPADRFAQDEIVHEMVHWTASDPAEPWQGLRFFSAMRFFEGGPPVPEPADVPAWIRANPAFDVVARRAVTVAGRKAVQLDLRGSGTPLMGGHNFDAAAIDGPVRVTVWERNTMWWVLEGVPSSPLPSPGAADDAYDAVLRSVTY